MLKILTISTLFNKGGAAHIASEIHDGLKDLGHDCVYLYGYGKNGLQASNEVETIQHMEYKFRFTPHINFVSHKLIGIDLFNPSRRQLQRLIDWADVIICHTLHSFMLNYNFLFKVFSCLPKEKKLFFIAHDSWHYTGRCAFRYECNGWKDKCTVCLNKDYYPSTTLSFSKTEFINKTTKIRELTNLTFVSPARWIAKDLKVVYPEKKIEVIRNGIDTGRFSTNLPTPFRQKVEFAVSCIDFRQEGKNNLMLIKELLDLGFKVHFIGKNCPYPSHENAVAHGYISDRKNYLEKLSNISCYLFTSKIDIYPTVLIDAICSGCYIFYSESEGAAEIMECENEWLGSKIKSAHEINAIVNDEDFTQKLHDISYREEVLATAIKFFDRKRMTNQYLKLITS